MKIKILWIYQTSKGREMNFWDDKGSVQPQQKIMNHLNPLDGQLLF